jgi:hypothetical protein
MARRVILDTLYTFSPSTRTITIPRQLPRERLLLITNVTSNQVIYNFSDPTLTATAYTFAQPTNAYSNPTTTITLAFNTTGMNASDQLSIVVDEVAEAFVPDEAYVDPVNKFRTSTPQALIDTDFEYGLQPTKWETVSLINNKPCFYINTQAPISISDIQVTNGSTLATVYVANNTVANSVPVIVQDSLFYGFNGPFLVVSTNSTSFQFNGRYPYPGTTGSIYDSTKTAAYAGSFYTGAALNINTQPSASANVVTVTTTDAHGMVIGNGILVANVTAPSNPPNGNWYISGVTNSTSFQFVTTSGTPTGGFTGGVVYPRPDGTFIHRAFDGGVQFTAGNNSHNQQTIRQTRRYFRYQSGKGVQIVTGTLMKPSINVDDVSGNTIVANSPVTVTTKTPHLLQPGATISMYGAQTSFGTFDSAYNGTYNVASILNPLQFTYTANGTPNASTAYGFPILSMVNWYGAAVRLGMFDNQNGLFFEYDGQQLYAVRRRSVDQIGGYVNVTNGSAVVTGANVSGVSTKFSRQLVPGDFIVIRGMSYRVIDILSDTQMTINPPYRGPSLTGTNHAVVSKTVDLKIPQSQWNIDRMDGTGPSGEVLDLSRKQMFYLDYSWYGSGSLRFGFRDLQGKVIYVHRFVNTNQNFEAWMRSGNLPARYEAHTFSPTTLLTSTVQVSDTTLSVVNTAPFANAGTLLIADPNSYEYVTYTGKTANSFTGVTRASNGVYIPSVNVTSNSNAMTTSSALTGIINGMYIYAPNVPNGTYVYSTNTSSVGNTIYMTQAAYGTGAVGAQFMQMSNPANQHTVVTGSPIPVYMSAPSFAPTVSHWGTSVIMDGGFDDDKSLIFTYGEPINTSIPSGATVPLLSIRASPSVDSGIPGILGQREIINRMQLKLYSTDVLTSGSVQMSLVLNGVVSNSSPSIGNTSTFARVTGSTSYGTSSLSQIADHTGNCVISGGETIYGFFAVNSAGANNTSVVSQDLTKIRDLGNSIIGGGATNNVGTSIYPDGPDVVTLTATNIGATSANVNVRLSWTEAQA